MTNLQNISTQKTLTANLAREGMKLGFKASLALSTFYAILGFFTVELLGRGVGFLSLFEKPDEWHINFYLIVVIIGVLLMIITILFLAIAPAIILGTITGMFIGKIAEIIKERIPKYFFVSLSIFSCLVIAILLHLFFHIPVVLSFQPPLVSEFDIYDTYPFYTGIPTVIYVLTGGWVGSQLYSKTVIKIVKQE